MPANDYHFLTRWRVSATCEEVASIISDAAALPPWWPSVYLAVEEREPGDERGIGRVIDLHTRGWLPYTLRWRFRVTESVYPHTFAIAAEGDFVGTGRWTFAPAGPGETDVTYDWRIVAMKPLLRRLSWALKPVFSANHRWAMERGRESLSLELRRRRAAGAAERDAIPPPPGAVSIRRKGPIPGALLAIAAATWFLFRTLRRT